MRISAVLILLAFLHVSATTLAQKVTLSVKNAPIATVFEQLSDQAGYDFVYSTSDVKTAKPVTISVKDAELADVLKQIFDDQPLDFSIEDKSVIVSMKQPAITPNQPQSAAADKIDITGKVVDETGQPIPSASVIVKGTGNSTITDAKGIFKLKNVEPNATIVITFVGFEKKELPAAADLGTIRLKVATNPLDEVKVIAYGETTERNNVGDVTTITAKQIEQQPVSNPLLALEGQVPGLFITQSTGYANGGVTVAIRGQNSIGSGNDPFYVIDGVPYTSELLPNLGGILGGSGNNGSQSGSGSPLSFINPDDIESISVLKDADATAIYGSRAANGAILITTKKGKAGETKITLNEQNGWGKVDNYLPLMSTQQYLQMRREAIANDGNTPSLANGDYDLLQYDTTKYFNWEKFLIGNTAHYNDVNASISGGSATTQFLASVTDHRETTVFPGDFADDKVSVHFSLNTASANNKFHFMLSGSYINDNDALPNGDLTYGIYSAPDLLPYNPNGTLNWAPNSSGASTFASNPLANLLNTYSNQTNNLVSNANLSYEIIPGLEVKSNFGYTNQIGDETVQAPLTSTPPEDRPYAQRVGEYGHNDISSWIIEPQLSYDKTWGKGKFSGLLGGTIEQNESNGQQYAGVGYSSDQLIADPGAATTIYPVGSTIATYKYAAMFARANYSWAGKYLIDLTARRDGSSRFGSANQFHDFESAGAGWIFSEEAWFKQLLPFISFGKLKGSYGTTGNDQIGDYNYLSLYSPNTPQVPYQNISSLQSNGLSNPYLQWEETKKAEVGIDVGLFKDRILFHADYSNNRSSNELLGSPLPVITGFGSVTENFPATVQNTAWEYTLTTANVKNSNFNWTTNFNLTVPENKLVSFPGLSSSNYLGDLLIGQPINIVQVYRYLGVNTQTGLYQFAGKSGPTSNPVYGQDNTAIVTPFPRFYGGLTNTFRYKAFSLEFMFQFTKQIGRSLATGNNPGIPNFNQPAYLLNAWTHPGQLATVQQYDANGTFGQSYGAATYSTLAYSDASYIRLKNASFSWQVPESILRPVHLQNARLYAQGQNLLTFTHYKGLDPETLSNSSLPPLRVITLGIAIGL